MSQLSVLRSMHRSARVIAASAASLLLGAAMAASVTDSAPGTPALAAAVEQLQREGPDQAHVMMDVEFHFSNLWYAAQKSNWLLAEFYLEETRSHLNWAIKLRPVRKLSTGGELPLAPILLGVQMAGITQLREAVTKHDGAAFGLAYRAMLTQCYACHVAAEKPMLRLRTPDSPATHMIDLAAAH
jgi:hypothetical protein